MDDFMKELLTLGRGHFQRKEYARAEKYLTQVAEKHTNFADVFNMLGVIYHDQGLYPRAQKAFEAALQINPSYTEAALNLAVIYNDMGNYQQAREVYQSAVSRSQTAPGELDRTVKAKLANMYADLGDVWLASGRPDDAIGEYARALKLAPAFVDIRAKLAGAMRDKGDREGALRELEQTVADAPQYLPARIQLGVVLYGLGRTPEAVAVWEKVLERDGQNKAAQMYLALVRDAKK